MNREQDLADQIHTDLMQMIPKEYHEDMVVSCSIHETNSGIEYTKTKVTITSKKPSAIIGKSGWIIKILCEYVEKKYRTQISLGVKEKKYGMQDEVVSVLSYSQVSIK